jgi:hypothetical protein
MEFGLRSADYGVVFWSGLFRAGFRRRRLSVGSYYFSQATKERKSGGLDADFFYNPVLCLSKINKPVPVPEQSNL